MSNYVIVSRHPAAIEFIKESDDRFFNAPVIAQAHADDVIGKFVAGNLPLNLAALAAEVVAVEFSGAPPRGAEYGIEEMRAAGAVLRHYVVQQVSSEEE